MIGHGNIAKTKQDGPWLKYVFILMAEKKLELCSRMDFRARIYRTDIQTIRE